MLINFCNKIIFALLSRTDILKKCLLGAGASNFEIKTENLKIHSRNRKINNFLNLISKLSPDYKKPSGGLGFFL